MSTPLDIRPVAGRADLAAFIDLPYRLYADDPNWIGPLRSEVRALLTPGDNPWFEHGEAQLFLARRGGRVVGRISAHIDRLALAQPAERGMGPETGNWGFFEAEDEATGHALLATAEDWLRAKGMTRATGPMSFAMFDEPGLLTAGFDHPPTVMMGHSHAAYPDWVERAGHRPIKTLLTYELDIFSPFPPLVERIVASGERNSRIVIRKVNKARFDEEAALILGLLNEAWSDNWGFVPLTPSEVVYAGKKLRPIIFEDFVRVAEVDGEPVAFMITLPDLNERLRGMNGRLYPFNWAKLLWWLRAPRIRTTRVPLMGVVKRLQATRLASQLAFMMIEFTRRDAREAFGATRGEFGWVLDDNQGMNAVGQALAATVNKTYAIYAKGL